MKFYYALWIPVLQNTDFKIIRHPKNRILQDSKEFPKYIIRGELEERTFHFSFFYKVGKREDEKCLQFKCEDKWNAGFLIYSIEMNDTPKDSLEERLQSKMPTFIYHYIKDFFHNHIHHHPSHDSLLYAYFSDSPLSFRSAVDKANIMEYYTSFYLQKFRAYTTNAQSVFAIAKQNINSRLSINKGIRQLEFLLNEGREILGEAEFCNALMVMGTSFIAKNIRKDIYEYKEQIEALQQKISFAYNLCTSSYGIRLGYWGVWFGVTGIFVSAASIFLTVCSSPDYTPITVRIDSLYRKGVQTDTLINIRQKEMNARLDSLDRHLKGIVNRKGSKPDTTINSKKQKAIKLPVNNIRK